MLDTILKNKKFLIATAIVIVLAIVLLLFTLIKSKGENKLSLSCSKTDSYDNINGEYKVDIYENGSNIIYQENNYYVFPSDNDERGFPLIYSLTMLSTKYGEDIFSVDIDKNVLNFHVNLDFSVVSRDIIEEIVGIYDDSISGLKTFLENGGFKCIEY